jgi:hypothetical protein
MGDVGGVEISSKRPFIVSKFFSMKSFMGHMKGSFSPNVRKLAKFWTLFAINIKSRATLQDACSTKLQQFQEPKHTAREAEQSRAQDSRADKPKENEAAWTRILDCRVIWPLFCEVLTHFTKNVPQGPETLVQSSNNGRTKEESWGS